MPDGTVIISRDTVAALLAAAQAWERATVHLQVVGRQAEAVWRLGQAITEAERVLTRDGQGGRS